MKEDEPEKQQRKAKKVTDKNFPSTDYLLVFMPQNVSMDAAL